MNNTNVNNEQVENKPVQVNASLSEWEEMMVTELAQKFGVDEDVVLNIGVTFLVNELSGSMNGKPSLLNSIHAAGANNEVTLPDVIEEQGD